MFALVERETGRIIELHEGDFIGFLDTKWGGYFPYELNGRLHCTRGSMLGCIRYDCYWAEVKPGSETAQQAKKCVEQHGRAAWWDTLRPLTR